MKNTINDLHNHLFASLERLSPDTGEKKIDLEREKQIAETAKAIVGLAKIEADLIKHGLTASNFLPPPPPQTQIDNV